MGPSIFKIDGGRPRRPRRDRSPRLPPIQICLLRWLYGISLLLGERGLTATLTATGVGAARACPAFSRKSRAVAEEGHPTALGPSRPAPTVRRFTPQLTWAIPSLGALRDAHLQGVRVLFAPSPGTSPQVPSDSVGRSPVGRIRRTCRASQRARVAVCLNPALPAAPEPARRSRSRALPAGRCQTRPRPRWGQPPPEPAAVRPSWPY